MAVEQLCGGCWGGVGFGGGRLNGSGREDIPLITSLAKDTLEAYTGKG